MHFIFGIKFSWNEGIDICFNVECVLIGRNFDFFGGYWWLLLVTKWLLLVTWWILLVTWWLLLVTWWLLVVTARYQVATARYWWLLVVTARSHF